MQIGPAVLCSCRLQKAWYSLSAPAILLILLHYILLLQDLVHQLGVSAAHPARWLITGLFCAVLLLLLRQLQSGRVIRDPIPQRGIALVVVIAAASSLVYVILTKLLSPLGQHLGSGEILLIALLLSSLRFVALRLKSSPVRLLAFSVLIVSLVRASLIVFIPLEPTVADMLPIIDAGARDFLNGLNPYRVYKLTAEHYPSAMNYYPLMWLSHVPLVGLGLDPRWLSVAIWPATVAVLFVSMHPASQPGRWCVLLTLALSPYIVPRYGLYAYPYWLCLVAALYGISEYRYTMASIALGLSLASRQFAILVIPFYLVLAWRDRGWLFALTQLVILATMAGLFLLPFVFWDWQAFKFITWDRFTSEMMRSFPETMSAISGFSFAPILYYSGLQNYFLPIQLAGLALLGIWGFKRIRTWRECLTFSTLSYAWFLLSSYRVSTYLYVPLLFFLAVLLSGTPDRRHGVSLEPVPGSSGPHPGLV